MSRFLTKLNFSKLDAAEIQTLEKEHLELQYRY